MLPRIEIFGKTIAMYGLMIAIGVVLGILVATLRRKKYNLSKDDVLFASCYAGIGLIIGAKLLYFLTILPAIIENWDKILTNYHVFLSALSGGFVFYGGLIGALIGYIIYCRQFKLNIITMLDLMAPSIPLIHGIGRIGCFMAGCCYGIEYGGLFHIVFKHSVGAPNGIALFPTQILSSILNLLTSLYLILYAGRNRKPGQVIAVYLILYTIGRFFLEFLRGDLARGDFLGVSTSQWISLLLIPLALWLYSSPKLIKEDMNN